MFLKTTTAQCLRAYKFLNSDMCVFNEAPNLMLYIDQNLTYLPNE